MSQDSHRLRQGPLGVGVGGVPAVVDGKAGDISGVLQVQVELGYHC